MLCTVAVAIAVAVFVAVVAVAAAVAIVAVAVVVTVVVGRRLIIISINFQILSEKNHFLRFGWKILVGSGTLLGMEYFLLGEVFLLAGWDQLG